MNALLKTRGYLWSVWFSNGYKRFFFWFLAWFAAGRINDEAFECVCAHVVYSSCLITIGAIPASHWQHRPLSLLAVPGCTMHTNAIHILHVPPVLSLTSDLLVTLHLSLLFSHLPSLMFPTALPSSSLLRTLNFFLPFISNTVFRPPFSHFIRSSWSGVIRGNLRDNGWNFWRKVVILNSMPRTKNLIIAGVIPIPEANE